VCLMRSRSFGAITSAWCTIRSIIAEADGGFAAPGPSGEIDSPTRCEIEEFGEPARRTATGDRVARRRSHTSARPRFAVEAKVRGERSL
jgi:hypothetical protein